jgi:polyisoprenyl-phosphate glycosyltransferase
MKRKYYRRLSKKLIMERMITTKKISEDSKIVFVNDGSKDKTWDIIRKFHTENKVFSGINLSRNRGHQNALIAGLLTSKDYADAVISLDADLQDEIRRQ